MNLQALQICRKDFPSTLFAEVRDRDSRALPRGTITNLQIILNTQTNPYLNQFPSIIPVLKFGEYTPPLSHPYTHTGTALYYLNVCYHIEVISALI